MIKNFLKKNILKSNPLERYRLERNLIKRNICKKNLLKRHLLEKNPFERYHLERNRLEFFLKKLPNLICQPNQTCCHYYVVVIYRFCSFSETLNEAFGTDKKLSSPLSINHCCCMQLQCTSEQQKDGNSISA